MSLMDSMQALLDKVKQRGMGGQDEEQQMTSNMANGGFSGYKPATAKHRVTRETGKQQPMQGGMPEQNGMPGFDMGAQQPMNYGFTGVQQDPWQQGAQATGYQSMPQMGTGYQQPVGGYQQDYQNQNNFQGTGYQSAFGAGYQQPRQSTGFQQVGTGYQQNMGWQDQGLNQQPWGMEQGYQQPQQGQMDNISYMPGNFVGNDGRAYSHVERVAQLTQVAACYRIIEFMRNGESVIVNTEMIADERENQRCLDLLYGAAFAMNCTLTRVSQNKDIYLLSPSTVMVVPYDSIRRMSDQDMNERWPDPEQMDARYGFGERRSQSSFRERREAAGRRSGYTDRYDNGYGSYAYAR